jgi:hypothetical protein
MRKNILYGLGMLLTIGLLWLYYSTLLGAIKSSVEERQKHEKELNDKTLENIFSSQKIDSLNKANGELSKYKALTQAMIHRDEATNQLKHKIGDMVYLKSDSARVVIEDVLIGGGKYNYYVKYRVLLKDNTTREMVPELIY